MKSLYEVCTKELFKFEFLIEMYQKKYIRTFELYLEHT